MHALIMNTLLIECTYSDTMLFLCRKFFLDAIPMTGTAASLRLMSQMLIGKEVSGIEADMWLTSLSFIQNPSVDMLAEVKVRLHIYIYIAIDCYIICTDTHLNKNILHKR